MFDYVGGKIKGFAIVICWLGIICSVIIGFVNISNGTEMKKYGSTGTVFIVQGLVIMVAGVRFL